LGPLIRASYASPILDTTNIQCAPVRTPAVTRSCRSSQGGSQFPGRVEKDRIDRLQSTPQLFEKYLPYAMALRVDTKWAKTFAGLAVAPPDWYKGSSESFAAKLTQITSLKPRMNTD
jgi:hypothetical protein